VTDKEFALEKTHHPPVEIFTGPQAAGLVCTQGGTESRRAGFLCGAAFILWHKLRYYSAIERKQAFRTSVAHVGCYAFRFTHKKSAPVTFILPESFHRTIGAQVEKFFRQTASTRDDYTSVGVQRCLLTEAEPGLH
jgi:hypothetical protein